MLAPRLEPTRGELAETHPLRMLPDGEAIDLRAAVDEALVGQARPVHDSDIVPATHSFDLSGFMAMPWWAESRRYGSHGMSSRCSATGSRATRRTRSRWRSYSTKPWKKETWK